MAQCAAGLPTADHERYAAQANDYVKSEAYDKAYAQYDKALQELNRQCQGGLENWSVIP